MSLVAALRCAGEFGTAPIRPNGAAARVSWSSLLFPPMRPRSSAPELGVFDGLTSAAAKSPRFLETVGSAAA